MIFVAAIPTVSVAILAALYFIVGTLRRNRMGNPIVGTEHGTTNKDPQRPIGDADTRASDDEKRNSASERIAARQASRKGTDQG